MIFMPISGPSTPHMAACNTLSNEIFQNPFGTFLHCGPLLKPEDPEAKTGT
jgi:hypothetical protein